jgi:hypothetical protein
MTQPYRVKVNKDNVHYRVAVIILTKKGMSNIIRNLHTPQN